MEPCPRCGRAEMAKVTHACTPQVTIVCPAVVCPDVWPPIDVPSIMRAGGFEEGVRAERARVVAWLRETGRYDNPWHLGDAADCIERGEHVVVQAAPPLRPLADETTETRGVKDR